MLGTHHALQRIRPSRSGCNHGIQWAGSLSLGRGAAPNVRAERVSQNSPIL